MLGCWDIYEFLIALENNEVSDSTKRLKANNAKVMDVDLEQLMKKLELSDLNCK
jgi:hypothetical protein